MESFATVSAIVIGLTAVIKKAGVSSRYLPSFAVVAGIGLALAIDGLSTASAVGGVVAALTGMGLYSGTSATIKK